jgi:hypothetical protein
MEPGAGLFQDVVITFSILFAKKFQINFLVDKLPSNKWNLTLFTQYKSEKMVETRESFECDEVQSSYVHLHPADYLLVKDIKEIIIELCPDDTGKFRTCGLLWANESTYQVNPIQTLYLSYKLKFQ